MMVVMYNKNQELLDHVKRNEVKINDLEKLVNAAVKYLNENIYKWFFPS